MVSHDTAGLGHDTVEVSACDIAERPYDIVSLRARVSGAHEGLANGGMCRDTINCIMIGRRLVRWVVS